MKERWFNLTLLLMRAGIRESSCFRMPDQFRSERSRSGKAQSTNAKSKVFTEVRADWALIRGPVIRGFGPQPRQHLLIPHHAQQTQRVEYRTLVLQI
jgi:hypothetical protein